MQLCISYFYWNPAASRKGVWVESVSIWQNVWKDLFPLGNLSPDDAMQHLLWVEL